MSSRKSAGELYVYEFNGCRLTDRLIDGRWVTVKVEPLPH